MKRITLTRVRRGSFQLMACLALVLLATAAAKAQQEVDPERFDKSSSTSQVKPVSHRKSNKSTPKRRPQKPATASAKSDSQKGQTGHGAQQVAR
jgi:hypothetical protein